MYTGVHIHVGISVYNGERRRAGGKGWFGEERGAQWARAVREEKQARRAAAKRTRFLVECEQANGAGELRAFVKSMRDPGRAALSSRLWGDTRKAPHMTRGRRERAAAPSRRVPSILLHTTLYIELMRQVQCAKRRTAVALQRP